MRICCSYNCSDPTPMLCSTSQGKMHSPMISAALQTGSQLACVTATTPMKICCSCKCAVTHHQCTAALVWAKCIPHCTALQNRLTACLCHCNHTCEDLLLIQVCSDPTPMHCSTAFGKMHSTLSSAALQHRLTTGLCHCNYTYEDLLLIQVCSDPTPMHCSTGFGKMHSTLSSAALQKRLTSSLCHCNQTYEDLLLIQVCSDPPPMHCSTCLGKMHFPLSSAALQTGSQLACVTATTPMKICCSCKCAVTHHQCTAALVWAKCISHCQLLLCKTGSQLACVTATTPMKICCSCKCAVTHHQCTAALVWAKCISHCPVLLCKTSSQHA